MNERAKTWSTCPAPRNDQQIRHHRKHTGEREVIASHRVEQRLKSRMNTQSPRGSTAMSGGPAPGHGGPRTGCRMLVEKTESIFEDRRAIFFKSYF